MSGLLLGLAGNLARSMLEPKHLLKAGACGLGCLAVLAFFYGCQPSFSPLSAPAVAASHEAPRPGESYLWREVAIGGGGFITGISMDSTGKTRVARADVYGAYLWLAEKDRWVQLINRDSMPDSLHVQDGGNEGVFEIVVAPSNAERVYMAFKGNIYRSDDRGRRFLVISPLRGSETLSFDANSPSRHVGPVMAVSPTSPDLVFFGSPEDGLWRSDDAGRNWLRIASIPYKNAPGNGVARPGMPIWIEQSRDSSQADVIWVMVQGLGMFTSIDHGRNFTVLSRDDMQPRAIRRGSFTKQSSFLGVDDVGKTVWRFSNGAWKDLVASGSLKPLTYAAIAVNPANSDIYLFDEGGQAFRSSDDGLSWTSLSHSSAAGTNDPSWLRVSNQSYFATGQVNFDPTITHRLWVAAGTGVYYADLMPGTREIRWISQTRGIEELVANDVIQPVGRPPLFAAWDFGIHVKPDLNIFSNTYGPKERVLIAAQQLDSSPSDPDFIVTNASDTRTDCCSEDGDAVLAGFSQDAGISWSKFSELPQPPGTSKDDPWRMSFGTIAVSANDSRNIIWQPTNNRSPFYTMDQGISWSRVKFEGERLPNTGSHALYSYARKTLAADRVLPGVFYLVHSGDGYNVSLEGLWRTDNGGADWRKVYEGEIAPSSQHSAKLRAVPGYEGHLFFTSGVSQESDMALRRSTDGGVSWQVLQALQRVDDIAFGKAATGGTYPTIFISGQIGGKYGIWRSTDNALSWSRLAEFPIGTLDQVTVVGADPNVFGRVYVGYKGSGWRYGEPAQCAVSQYRFPDNAECFAVHQ